MAKKEWRDAAGKNDDDYKVIATSLALAERENSRDVLETTGKEVKGKEVFSGNSLELDEGVTITAKDGGLTEKTNSRD